MNGVVSYLLETIKTGSVLCAPLEALLPKALEAPPDKAGGWGLSHTVLYIHVCGHLQCLEAAQSWLHRIRNMFLDFVLVYWYLK